MIKSLVANGDSRHSPVQYIKGLIERFEQSGFVEGKNLSE
jgi:hypothetical protein